MNLLSKVSSEKTSSWYSPGMKSKMTTSGSLEFLLQRRPEVDSDQRKSCNSHTKTVQEHSASDHVVKRLLSDDRGPWEALVEQFHKDVSTDLPDRQREPNTITYPCDESHQEVEKKNATVKSALLKFSREILSRPGIEMEAIDFCRKLFFDDDIDLMRISDALTSNPIINEVLTEEEKTTLAHFLVEELLMELEIEKDKEPKAKIMLAVIRLRFCISLRDPSRMQKYLMFLKEVVTFFANSIDASNFKDVMLFFKDYATFDIMDLALEFASASHLFNYQENNTKFTELQGRVAYHKTLFRFIIGKLADHPDLRDAILQEMAVLLIQHSFDPFYGDVLPVDNMLFYVWDLRSESLPDKNCKDPFSPPLVYLRSGERLPGIENLEPDTPCALKVFGMGGNIAEFIPKVTNDTQHLRNIHILELKNMEGLDQDVLPTYQKFTAALYRSPNLVSIELNNVDPKLRELLMENLPLSVHRLAMGMIPVRTIPKGVYRFPKEVHLTCLYFHNCFCRVEDLFTKTTFPHLKKISSNNKIHCREGKDLLTWTREDAQSLLDAVRRGRMPVLEELNIRDSCLTGCGPRTG